jgi:hypothetical protein
LSEKKHVPGLFDQQTVDSIACKIYWFPICVDYVVAREQGGVDNHRKILEHRQTYLVT